MNTQTLEIIDIEYCTIEWLQKDIVLMRFKDDIKIDEPAAIEITNTIVEFVNYKPFKIIADTQNIYGSLTSEGRTAFYSAPTYMELRQKTAFLVNSLPTRLFVNFYQRFSSKQKNIKSFSSLDKAILWLKEE